MTHTDSSLFISVYYKYFAVTIPTHTRSCHPACHKMTSFHTFVNRALHLFSDSHSLNTELRYYKSEPNLWQRLQSSIIGMLWSVYEGSHCIINSDLCIFFKEYNIPSVFLERYSMYALGYTLDLALIPTVLNVFWKIKVDASDAFMITIRLLLHR